MSHLVSTIVSVSGASPSTSGPVPLRVQDKFNAYNDRSNAILFSAIAYRYNAIGCYFPMKSLHALVLRERGGNCKLNRV